jgi:hypothetical protein
MTMFRQLIVAAATAGLVATSATVAQSKSRHQSGFYAPSYGYGYSSGERTDPSNTNGF